MQRYRAEDETSSTKNDNKVGPVAGLPCFYFVCLSVSAGACVRAFVFGCLYYILYCIGVWIKLGVSFLLQLVGRGKEGGGGEERESGWFFVYTFFIFFLYFWFSVLPLSLSHYFILCNGFLSSYIYLPNLCTKRNY